jgi:transcriptional regulator with XRE-family HTH domain
MKRSTAKKKSKSPHRPPACKTSLGDLLRGAREKRGLTLRDVEAETGLLSGGISFLENGRSVPDLLTAYTLGRFYRISLNKLAAAFLKDGH